MKTNKTFIVISAPDGSSVRFRAAAVSLVQIPPSRFALVGQDTNPVSLIIIDGQPMQFSVPIGEQVAKMLDEIDSDLARDKAQNMTDLTGQGPSRN